MLRSIMDNKSVALVLIHLSSYIFQGEIQVGLVDQLPVSGVDFLLENDLALGEDDSLSGLIYKTNGRKYLRDKGFRE